MHVYILARKAKLRSIDARFLVSNSRRLHRERHVEITLQDQVRRSSAAGPGNAHVRWHLQSCSRVQRLVCLTLTTESKVGSGIELVSFG
jgi:hypothetical protein